MRRFFTLICLLCLTIPAGISVTGCTRNPGANYCNGLGYGTKIDDVTAITLQPATTGISMAFGQTRQVSSPSATTCKGTAASASSYSYGTSNSQLVDISPGGNICAGTWNRNTGGGIANYTICSPPNPLPATGGLPYATAYVTASAQSVTSNPVEVYVHVPVTSVSLVTTPTTGSAQQCFSQGTLATLDAQACYTNSSNQQVELCAPASVTSGYACPLPSGVTSVPTCTAAIGTLGYTVGTSSVASISTNTTTNAVTITADQPGTTVITSSVAGSGSSAGYFSTCPPASIKLELPDGFTTGTINKGITQNLVHTFYDTKGVAITGLSLEYESTDPIDISATSGGSITANNPGVASIYAVCQPPSCNPSPINEIGLYGTGLPVSSNPVTITTLGTAGEYVWFAAPGQSQYIIPMQILNGPSSSSVGSTIRLPYVPNSMLMDRQGTSIYFGSPYELMVFSASSGTVTSQNTSVPGVVLAVSPNNSQVLINDQERQLFYILTVSSGSVTTFSGVGNAAAWSPDSNTLYITDSKSLNDTAEGVTGHTDTLYIYNANTGWITYALAPSLQENPPLPPGVLPATVGATSATLPANVATSSTVQTPAVLIPSVGAFLRGSPTDAHTWCPSGTVGNYAGMSFYPQGPSADDNSVSVPTDALTTTTDGAHVLGASLDGPSIVFSDIDVTIPQFNCLTLESGSTYSPLNAGDTLSPLVLTSTQNPTPVVTEQLSGVNATAINQVVASPASNLAFVTYTSTASNTNATLPYYVPASGATPSSKGNVTLVTQKNGTAPIAPLAGAFTPDDALFFVSTAGDNMIHYISVPLVTSSPASADIMQISPKLPSCTPVSSGGTDAGCTYTGSDPGTAIVPATGIAIKPRATT